MAPKLKMTQKLKMFPKLKMPHKIEDNPQKEDGRKIESEVAAWGGGWREIGLPNNIPTCRYELLQKCE